MKKKNPFTITFGIRPDNYISRLSQSEEIISSFENNTNNVFMITGVRGSGKTALLTHISEYFDEKNDWAVIELISEADLLDQLASKLYDMGLFHKIFNGKTFGFSFQGLSFSIKGEKPVTNVVSLIEILLEKIQKKKKVLICVDEAVNNTYMKPFVQTIQLLLRKRYPIYILMTGLYQNLYDLQNNDSLTFLYRAPKINLEPLNIQAIASEYRNVFKIEDKEAIELAYFTKGYAYAYQVLGYLLYENNKNKIDNKILSLFDQYVQDYVYDKIWSELSGNDKKVLWAIDTDEPVQVENIMNKVSMDKRSFSVYRDRLIKRGLLASPEHGKLILKLPRFYEFLELQSYQLR